MLYIIMLREFFLFFCFLGIEKVKLYRYKTKRKRKKCQIVLKCYIVLGGSYHLQFKDYVLQLLFKSGELSVCWGVGGRWKIQISGEIVSQIFRRSTLQPKYMPII